QIRALDSSVVHQICTNQVIVSLETCVKELVENSLDAGATSISITFTEGGVEALEVMDDGCGIATEDLKGLCRRHHTSKLRQFEEIHKSLDTFGFRGEALAAVCALSDKFEVTTRAKKVVDPDSSSKNHAATSTSSTTNAAPSSTSSSSSTSTINALPSTTTNFIKHARQQLAETTLLLQQYAVSRYDVRFQVRNRKRDRKGEWKLTDILKTPGNHKSLKACALSVHGESVRASLEVDLRHQPLQLSDFNDDAGNALVVNATQEGRTGGAEPPNSKDSPGSWRLHGIISTASGGRSNKALQHFFVNRRPAAFPKKIARAINDTYRT
ncbi:unnamed protein product, partial [Amoebophrya sp. A25]